MKRLLLLLLIIQTFIIEAQNNGFDYSFYGQIRTDVFYNSRANVENVDGLIYLYPKDHDYDADGYDLNAGVQGNLYMLYTRLGVDIKGPKLGDAVTTAKVEVDFRGSGTNYAVPRIREAYANLAWKSASLLIGQSGHPLRSEVMPQMLNLSTGAPFQPLNRSPQVKYTYMTNCSLQFTAATVWQVQYSASGPDGKSSTYLKNSCIPELYAGIDYKGRGWQTGIGAEFMSLCPRKQSTVEGKVYKVDERTNSLTLEAHAKYSGHGWYVAARTSLAENLTQCSMIGGYAVTSIDERTGKCKYTPFRHSISWLNLVYGKKWQCGLFLGYLKNLGTGKAIVGKQYGVGTDVGQLISTNLQLSYNLTHWKVGVEFEPSTAWYGKTDMGNGRIIDTHSVTNYRVLGVMMYIF